LLGGIKVPIIIPENLPAYQVLTEENIFIMSLNQSVTQDIRPLEILILNLMPTKVITETQLLRLLGNTPLQVNITFLKVVSYLPKNIQEEHMLNFYEEFSHIKNQKYDGFIITGAPVENSPFEEVEYWDELTQIMEFSKTNVTSTLHICWGAQAALYYHYGIDKYPLPQKKFGIFECNISNESQNKLLRGFDDSFFVPHSRHTSIAINDIETNKDLIILSKTGDNDANIIISKDKSQIFLTGHLEYDKDTLYKEYIRDLSKDIPINIPDNYFLNDDPNKEIIVRWRSHAHLLFSNWLNYYVYQETPYKL
jgi:homoserine O-succinyltransferase